MRHSEETIEIQTDDWKTAVVLLTFLFVGGGFALVAWGIWDLLESDAAQRAFATAIKSLGYGATALVVLLGLGAAAYGFGFLVKAAAPLYLARGVSRQGGVFRSDGLVISLPKNFDQLPSGAQQEILKGLISSQSENIRRLPAAANSQSDVRLFGKNDRTTWQGGR